MRPQNDERDTVNVSRTVWVPLLVISLAWVMGGFLYWASSKVSGQATNQVVGWVTGWFIGWATGGLFTGLALQLAAPGIRREHVFAIAAGWAVGGAIYASGWAIYGSGRFIHTFHLYLKWWADRWAIRWIISGAVGGLATGLVLRWALPTIRPEQVLVVTAGWAIGYALYDPIWRAVSPKTTRLIADIPTGALVGQWISWAVVGAIGGGVTLWVLYRARRRSEDANKGMVARLG